MDNRIRSILIVGGGTAGWLSAAYLNRALGPGVEITLVESTAIGRIGVGEATIPTLRNTMRFLGAEEEEWMPKCNATFKTAIRFVNWTKPARAGTPDVYYHPFSERPEKLVAAFDQPYFPVLGEGVSIMHYWLREHLQGVAKAPMAYACSPGPRLCDLRKSPRFRESPEHEIASAYHLDAGLLAGFLRDLAMGRGVKHVVADIAEARLDTSGAIQAVICADGLSLTADLYLDCTGFRGLLINQALGEPFISDTPSLLCDSAVAISARNDPGREGIPPYTQATALGHGWVWDIPLYHRNGCGYVYSSAFLGRDEAEAELRAFLGPRAEGMEPNHIRIRTGRNRNQWVKNCVSVGLSSCFIEPLESTGIFIVEYQLSTLLTLFPDRSFDEARIRRYNEAIGDCYEELRDFVVMHYCTTDRDDTPFWNAVQHDTVVPDSLKEKLDFFATTLPTTDGLKFAVFRARNYGCILAGMRRLPKSPYPLLEHLDPSVGQRELARIAAHTETLARALPDQFEYLTNLHYRAASRA
ncbi:MAG: tryptophan halogenase family protein [Polyangiaceae bacterium]